jgi:hypothetical protein
VERKRHLGVTWLQMLQPASQRQAKHAVASMSKTASAIAPDPGRVMSIPETAARANIGYSTLKREIAAGRGPKLTRMCDGRVGVTERNFGAWINEKTED